MVTPQGKPPIGVVDGDVVKLVGRTYRRLVWGLLDGAMCFSFACRESSHPHRRGQLQRRRRKAIADCACDGEPVLNGSEVTESGCKLNRWPNVGLNHNYNFYLIWFAIGDGLGAICVFVWKYEKFPLSLSSFCWKNKKWKDSMYVLPLLRDVVAGRFICFSRVYLHALQLASLHLFSATKIFSFD